MKRILFFNDVKFCYIFFLLFCSSISLSSSFSSNSFKTTTTTYHVEIVVVVFGMVVHRSNVTCLLVPVSVEIVGHDGDPVHVLTQGGDVVA